MVHWPHAFSWTLSPSKVKEEPSGLLWDASKRAARAVLAGERIPSLMDALFYHADYLDAEKISWASNEYLVAKVGTHVFYDNDRKKK
ncbi:Cell Wall Hydrolase [compost metagenome]